LAELPAGSVPKQPRQTVRRNFPPVRPGEAPVYAALADAAHAAGFATITSGQIHKWVNDGLLPPTAEQRSVGRHGFETVRLPGAENQLLALCRLRAQTKSWDRLAILLWLDSWQISSDRLRRAMLEELGDPRELGLDPSRDADLDKLDEYAQRRGPAFARRAGLGHVGPTAAADGVMAALSVTFGGAPWDEEAAQAMERLAGLSRARTDAIGDAGPWLDGPAAPPIDLSGFAFKAPELIRRATQAELDAARPRARALAVDMPRVAHAAELGLGINIAGLGLLAGPHVTPAMAVAVSLVFGDLGLGDQLDAMTETWSGLALQAAAAMPLMEAYIAKHPEQRRAIRSGGLQGLADRGEVVAFEPSELEALLGPTETAGPDTPPTAQD
jgi:hypothetical protein